MKRNISELKALPKLQLPSQTKKTGTLRNIEAVKPLPRLTIPTKLTQKNVNKNKYELYQKQAQEKAKEESYKKFGGINDANDPYTLNSQVDAIFNRKAKEKALGDWTKSFHAIPVLGDIVTGVAASFYLAGESFYDLFTGDFKAWGINALTNFSETVDIFANPVKSLITPLVNKDTSHPMYNLPLKDRLAASMGFSEHGRYNYNYDTGFWLSDIGLEIISDPLNLITLFLTGGASAGVKASSSAVAKGTAKGVAKEVGEEVLEQGAKVLTKTGKELTEEAFEEIITKKAAKQVVSNTIRLRELGTKISSATKRVAFNFKDETTKALGKNLDEAISATKGIIDDTTKRTVNDIVEQAAKLSKNGNLSKGQQKALTELLKLTDEFQESANYTLKDLLGKVIGDTADNTNKVFNKAGKKSLKTLKKNYKDLTDPKKLKEYTEQLSILFSDPAYFKKYRHILNLKDINFNALASKIDLTDYLDAANTILQKSRGIKFARAMDAIATPTKAIDKAILVGAFHGASPILPFTTKVLKPGIGLLAKGISKTGFGKFTIKALHRNLDDIAKYFKRKFGNAALLEYQEIESVYRNTLKQFDILSGSKLADTGFEKELAQSIYNETFNWLRGYGDNYAIRLSKNFEEHLDNLQEAKPFNILQASPEEQKNQIWNIYKERFIELGIDEDEAVEYFYKELDRMGQLGFGLESLKDWSISDYVNQLRITDSIITARRAFKDFDEVFKAGSFEGKSKSAVLKYIKDFEFKNITQPQGALNSTIEILNGFVADATGHNVLINIKSKVTDIFKANNFSGSGKTIHGIATEIYALSKNADEVSNAFKRLDRLKKSKALKHKFWAQEDVCYDAVKKMQGTASRLRVQLSKYAKLENFSSTEFSDLYKQLQKISSPYYGQAYRTKLETKTYFEIANNPRLKTIEILKDKNFQEFINAVRPGQPIRKALDFAYKEAEGLKDSATLLKIQSVFDTVKSVDAYVEHYALVKQSELPEFLQEIYLDTLAELPIREASKFLQQFDANSAEVIRRMNETLTSRFAKHTYELDYFAAQLSEMDGFKASANRFLNSTRSISDEVDLIEATYRAKVLPELSLKVKDELGNETSQYVHRAYNAYKDKQKIFVGFKTTGSNPNLDSVSDLGFKFKDKTWTFDSSKTEIDNLLDFYKALKEVADSGESIFITHNAQQNTMDFLRTRMYELMEETYTKGLGSEELYRAYRNAQIRNAEPEELAELFDQMQETVNPEMQKLFRSITEAQIWFEQNFYYTNVDCVTLLKKFDDVPTVGEYFYDIKNRFLSSYIRRQSSVGGNINLTLDTRFLNNLMTITPNLDNFKDTISSLHSVLAKVQDYDSTLASRGGAYFLNGHVLIDGDFYKKGVHKTAIDTIKAHEIQVPKHTKLLNLTEEGRWVYNNITLPEDITTANSAVRYLKSKGITYAPEWKALTPEQQLTAYPVMINGKITLQQIEGTIPVVVKKYIDNNLVGNYFDLIKAEAGVPYWKSLKKQAHYTSIAEQMSEVLAKIQNPGVIDDIAPVVNRIWDTMINYLKGYQDNLSPYTHLKDTLNVYQKYAALVVMLNDNTIGTPRRLLKKQINEVAGTISAKEYVDLMGLEAPIKPIDASKPWNGFRGRRYLKITQMPNYQKPAPYIFYKSKYSLKADRPLERVYFDALTKARKDPTITYREATEIAYEAYRKAVQSENSKNNIIYAINRENYKRYKKAISEENKKQQEYLHSVYLKELEAYNAWWEDIKQTTKILEDFEKQRPEIIEENALRSKAAKMFYKPDAYLSRKSDFRRIFEENHKYSSLGYSDNTFSRTSYIDHIYSSEMRGTVDKARELYDALQEVNQDVVNSTKAFKTALERPKTGGQFRSVYAPGMQRHATLGSSLIDLNNKVIEVTQKFKDTAAFDTFIACDRQVVNNLEDATLLQVLRFSPEELTSFVHHQGKGVVVIPVGKYLTDRTAHNLNLKELITNFVVTYGKYNSDTLGVKRVGDNLIMYIKDYQLHVKQQDISRITLRELDIDDAFTKAYSYPVHPEILDEFYRERIALLSKFDKHSYDYQKALNNLYDNFTKKYRTVSKQFAFLIRNYDEIEELRVAYKKHFNSLKQLSVDYDAQYAFLQGGYGRTMDFQTYKTVMDYLPNSVRKEMGLLNDIDIEKIFNTETGDIFNFTTLGRASYRLELEPYASSNYQSIMASTYRSMAYNLSAATQYAQFYFEDSPWTLKNFFEYATDESEMLVALKRTDAYTISTLQVNSKGLPVVKELKVDTLEDLHKALNANAIITPTTTYGSIAQTLNNKLWSNSKFKWFHKLCYYTKMAMLILHPGFIFRNLCDSTLKNVLITKDKSAVLENYIEAMDLHRRYQEVVDMLFAINPEHPFRPDVLEIVLKDSTSPLTEAQFMLIHNFYENGPSAGSIKKVADYYLEQSAKNGKVEKSTLQRFIDCCMQPTKDLEDITRFAAYIEATKRGLTNIDAFELIRKTHFDYGTKTNAQHFLELIFPFYSFKLKNFEFWLDFASKNPMVTLNLIQMATNEWNWSEIDFERIEYYQSKINHMQQANIQLNEKGLTLKLNPSIMDPVNMLLNPIESFADSVAPWIQPIVDAIQQNETYNPEQLIGTTAGAGLATFVPGLGLAGLGLSTASQYSGRLNAGIRSANYTGSFLPLIAPSIFGSVKTPAQYGKASYTNSRAFMDPEFRRPRRVSIYNKYYTDTGKNRWKIRFYPIDASTVQYRIRDNYNRFR